jgi:hypothetical protein
MVEGDGGAHAVARGNATWPVKAVATGPVISTCPSSRLGRSPPPSDRADAAVAVRQEASGVRYRAAGRRALIQRKEIVAEARHFAEAEHRRGI